MSTYLIHHLLSPHLTLKTAIKNTSQLITYLLLKLLRTIGLCFAYIINAFFFTPMFVLLDVPSYVVSFFSSLWIGEQECEDCMWSGGEAGCEGWRCGGGKIGGDLEGWCRMRVCRTDEISEFELDGDEEEDEGFENEDSKEEEEEEKQEEEKSVLMGEKQRQSLERVRVWAAGLSDEGKDDGVKDENMACKRSRDDIAPGTGHGALL